MGHSHFLLLPKTPKWKYVLDLIDAGAGVGPVVSATIDAVESQLSKAVRHQALTEAVALICELAAASKGDSLVQDLEGIGLRLTGEVSPAAIAVAASEVLERRTADATALPDFAEITRHSAIRALLGLLHDEAYDPAKGPKGAHAALKDLSEPQVLNAALHNYFGLVSASTVLYFLSRALPSRVGTGRRFRNLEEMESFSTGVSEHCINAANRSSNVSGQPLKVPDRAMRLSTSAVREYTASSMTLVLKLLRRGSMAT